MATEKRIDPDDGSAYTWEEFSEFYNGKYKKKEIAAYWEDCEVAKKKKAEKIWRRYKKEVKVTEIEAPGWSKDWVDIIGELKHSWAGHVARLTEGDIVKTAMKWKNRNWWAFEKCRAQCERRLKRGAPRKRWEDPLQNFMRIKHGDMPWQSMACDRKTWSKNRADFCCFP